MLADRTLKLLLFAVVAGLWLNLIVAWTRPLGVRAAQPPAAVQDFLDYTQLVMERRQRGEPVQDIEVLLLTHIAGHTAGISRQLTGIAAELKQ